MVESRAGQSCSAPLWKQVPLRGDKDKAAKPTHCGLLAAVLSPKKGRGSALGLVNTAGSFLNTLEDSHGGNLSNWKWLSMKIPPTVTYPLETTDCVRSLLKCPSLPPLSPLTSLSLSLSLRVFASFFFSHLCKGNRHDAESPL